MANQEIDGARCVNQFEKRKIGSREQTVLILASVGKWEAQLAMQVYSYGQTMVVWRETPGDKEETDGPAPLGEAAIREPENLIKLIDVISRVIMGCLKTKACEKLYLVSLSESGRLHFWLLPRYKQDKENADPDGDIGPSGYWITASWLHRYLQRSNKARRTEGNSQIGGFVPFKHACQEYNAYQHYAEEFRELFNKGWTHVARPKK